MNTIRPQGISNDYSILSMAGKHFKDCLKVALMALLLPIPLIAGATLGFFYFEPTWYTDIFLWSLLILFVAGQFGALFQLINIGLRTKKAEKTISVLQKFGNEPDLYMLENKLLNHVPYSDTRESILRLIKLGQQGETDGFDRVIENSALRRDQNSSKVLGFHNLVNRMTLKLGFLGTLIGLLMTFEPMKQAMLSLQGSDGEFQFINDIVKAIDGDAYAILTTLFATALSIFIELITIQILSKTLDQYEMANNNLDDWCVIHLQPWVKKKYVEKKSTDYLIKMQKEFSEKVTSLQLAIDEQIRNLAEHVENTSTLINSIIPFEKDLANKFSTLIEYENEYRQFISQKLQGITSTVPNLESKNE
ncbi:hypothetical protein QA601_16985 [Chitinispirillales bacterium ANBcel5]|uniref:hypothetical protein n=1 Tax=Cellulosispirillum alkaliphilum TaxID=3039283 RepID=UPI002A566292|nr:hypothetical protein [Chitinispirillales bacterium ANBcel5]